MPQVDREQFLLTTGHIVKQMEKNPILCRVKRKRLTREENQSYLCPYSCGVQMYEKWEQSKGSIMSLSKKSKSK